MKTRFTLAEVQAILKAADTVAVIVEKAGETRPLRVGLQEALAGYVAEFALDNGSWDLTGVLSVQEVAMAEAAQS